MVCLHSCLQEAKSAGLEHRAGHKREQTHLTRTEHKAKHTQENHKDVFKDQVLVSKAIFEWKM